MANPNNLTQAIQRLDYRVTVGDVAAEAGLPLLEAQQAVLALATDVQAHLQVSESGEIAYVFPKNLQAVLLSKSWRLRWQAAWQRIWKVLFYLIRISFGLVLILSLLLIVVAITILVIAASASRQGDDNDSGGFGGGMVMMPRVWFGPDIFWLFDFNPDRSRRKARQGRSSELNFLEAIFSVLFGDGDPNADLEERRWQSIATVIRANGGAVVAEQITPFLSDLGQGWAQDFEDFMLPVLSRFNGLPQVSPEGEIVYQFPELQVTAAIRRQISPPKFLKELPRQFTQANAGQVMTAIGLGSANFIGALLLGSLLRDQVLVAELGGVVALANSIYWLLLAYGTAFLSIPLGRYFWVQWQNRKITARNQARQDRFKLVKQPDDRVKEKLAFAATLTGQTVVGSEDLAYTTEVDLVEQEAADKDKLDAEWQKRLEDLN